MSPEDAPLAKAALLFFKLVTRLEPYIILGLDTYDKAVL